MLASSLRIIQRLVYLSGWQCVLWSCVLGCARENERLKLANTAMTNKEYTAAVEYFSEAISTDPRLLAAYLGRAQAHEQLREFNAAVADYEMVLAWYPQHKVSNDRLGQVYLQMGEGFKAREHIIKLDKNLSPTDYLLYMTRAELMCGEPKKALGYVKRLLDIEPNHSQGKFFRGIAYTNSGQLNEADADFTAVIAAEPEKASAYWRRAVVRERLKETMLATADRKRATELDPTHAFAESELGKNMVESLKGTNSEAGAISLQPLRK